MGVLGLEERGVGSCNLQGCWCSGNWSYQVASATFASKRAYDSFVVLAWDEELAAIEVRSGLQGRMRCVTTFNFVKPYMLSTQAARSMQALYNHGVGCFKPQRDIGISLRLSYNFTDLQGALGKPSGAQRR